MADTDMYADRIPNVSNYALLYVPRNSAVSVHTVGKNTILLILTAKHFAKNDHMNKNIDVVSRDCAELSFCTSARYDKQLQN